MKRINLRDFYPEYYKNDYFIKVSNKLANQLTQWRRDERTYVRQRYRKRAHYSLDRADGIEHDVLFVALSPDDLYERKLTMEQLYAAILLLPEIECRRIYAHYFLGLKHAQIAEMEGVTRSAITLSIGHGLESLEKILKKISI